MRARELGLREVVVALLLPGFAVHTLAQTNVPTPYASIAADGEGYAGPGRAPAHDLTGKVIRIGLLAPLRGVRKAEGDAMVAAAGMALQDAASQPLNGGRRIVLAVENASGGSWGIVSDAIIRLMLDDQAIAVVTSTSAADTHLCEQVGNRLGVPVLTLSTDPSTTQIDIPWIFRMGPSDVEEARAGTQDKVAAADGPTGKRREFGARFRHLTGTDPTRTASETYDAVILVVSALQIAGPNRARVRDALAKADNVEGVSGRISFDREGNNRVALHPVQPK
jgi:ABC-type branched-subunit amino acid transport system substrate-binding protein